MRTINATLQAAMENQSGEPIFRVRIHNGASSAINDTTTYTLTPYKFRIKNLEMQVTIDMKQFVEIVGTSSIMALQIGRGMKVSGIDYWVNSAWYSYETIKTTRKYITFNCNVFPPRVGVNVAGDNTVENVLNAAIEQNNYSVALPHTSSFELPAITEWWHGIQFYPTGKQLTSQSQRHLASILKQKYLAYLYVGDDSIFRAISKNYNFENETWIEIANSKIISIDIEPQNLSRRYIWRDEADTVYDASASTNFPIHNFGFIPSTATPQTDGRQTGVRIQIPPDLRFTPEDYLYIPDTQDIDNGSLGPTIIGYCEVEEVFDPTAKIPWSTTLSAIDWLNNTAGGAMPSTIERVAAYTPLVSTGFDGNLTPAVNNLQALAQAVDDMPPGVTNGDSHNHSGGDGGIIKYTQTLPAHGLNTTAAAGATNYLPFYYYGLNAENYNFITSKAGTVKNLSIVTGSAQPASGSLVLTVQKNNVDTAIVITIPAGTAAGTFTDVANTVTVVATNKLIIKVLNNATGVSAIIGGASLELEIEST